jgi:hypothetical protein
MWDLITGRRYVAQAGREWFILLCVISGEARSFEPGTDGRW